MFQLSLHTVQRCLFWCKWLLAEEAKRPNRFNKRPGHLMSLPRFERLWLDCRGENIQSDPTCVLSIYSLATPAASSPAAQCSDRSRGRREADRITQNVQSTRQPFQTSLCLFFSLTILFRGSFAWLFGGRQSYQTGIHHKSTPSPELVQLPAPQRHRQAGEESARHQVEQSRLAHLHHGQSHEGDEQADAVRCRERRRHEAEHTQTHTGPISTLSTQKRQNVLMPVEDNWSALINKDS